MYNYHKENLQFELDTKALFTLCQGNLKMWLYFSTKALLAE